MQAFFRLGQADARVVAAALSAGTGERVSKIAADVAKRDADGLPEAWASVTHTVRDGYGDAVELSAPAWTAFKELARKDGAGQVEALTRLARVSGVERLYVQAADSKQPVELSRYVAKAGPEEYRVTGPAPVRLTVSFPRPRLSVVSRETEGERQQAWTRTLMELPVRQAVLRLAGDTPGVVKVVAVADPTSQPGFEKFVSAAVAGGGQSANEVEETLAWRRAEVEAVALGQPEEMPPPSELRSLAEKAASGPDARHAAGALPAAGGRKRREPARMRNGKAEIAPRPPACVSAVPAGTVGEDGSLA